MRAEKARLQDIDVRSGTSVRNVPLLPNFAHVSNVSTRFTRRRTCSCVFLSQNGTSAVLVVVGGEILLFFVYKAARRDLWFWVPLYGGLGVFSSFLNRLTLKLFSDYTACPQARHPQEVGGAYYSFSMVCTVAIGMGSALTYNEVGGGGLSQHTVITIMIVPCVGLLISYTSFLMTIKRSYFWTFFDTRTGNMYIQERFLSSELDRNKLSVFATNEYKWKGAIGEEVKTWLQGRLPVWLEEQPKWLTDNLKSILPDWAIDDPAMLARIRNKKVEAIRECRRRRSSVVGLIGVQDASIAPRESMSEEEDVDTASSTERSGN